MPEYFAPEIWDSQTKDNGFLRSVTFKTPYFLIGTRKYKICDTILLTNGDALHGVKNMETGTVKEVTGATIRTWVEQLKN